jgi:hypothetical protein
VERNEERVGGTGRGAPGTESTAAAASGDAVARVSGHGGGRQPGDDGRSRAQPGRDGGPERARVREKAAELKTTLADKLEAGADTLRYRTRDGAEYVAARSADIGAAATQRLGHYSDTVASGMERTAGWLRRGDLGDVGDVIVEQVQEHPARTLLITLGVGYLIGRMLKD